MIRNSRSLRSTILHTHASRLIKSNRFYSIIIDEPTTSNLQQKPKLSQFKYAIFNTLIISLGTYLGLHIIWSKLEYREKEKKLIAKSNILEDEIKNLIELKNSELVEKNHKSWRSWFRFW